MHYGQLDTLALKTLLHIYVWMPYRDVHHSVPSFLLAGVLCPKSVRHTLTLRSIVMTSYSARALV